MYIMDMFLPISTMAFYQNDLKTKDLNSNNQTMFQVLVDGGR